MYKKAILSTTIIWILLALIIPKKHPLPEGDSTIFWEIACGVELESFNGYFPYARAMGIFPSQRDQFFYYYKEHHGLHVFSVNKASLNTTTNQVFDLLNKEITTSKQRLNRHNDMQDKNDRRLNCQRIRNEVSSDENTFLSLLTKVNPEQLYLDIFNRQMHRAQYYWLAIFFEALFLPLWWLFTFHPGIFGQWQKKRSIRIAFSPLLLFIPYFLGYAKYFSTFNTLTDGIFYPIFLIFFSIPFRGWPQNTFDTTLLLILGDNHYVSISPTVVLFYMVVVLAISFFFRKIGNAENN